MAKDFIKELEWRGMLHDKSPGIEEYLSGGRRRAYIGFDPTAPSMTIGNYVQFMILAAFQRCGHQPIVLMGGATGRIGDPSGKDEERKLKPADELDRNLKKQAEQARRILDFEDPENGAILVNNLDYYRDMNVLDFLRTIGKTLTVNYMMSKESVKNRLESGISFTEFSYQLIQAYDFQRLYQDHDCRIQMGGSDQWGNITSGTEFIRRNIDGKAYGVTTPLLTKADGSKFGKSTSGNIWLDPEMTSPYKYYQFWINADDRDIGKLLRYFSYKSRDEIESIENRYENDPRRLKAILAEELTRRLHGDEAFEAVAKVTGLLFSKSSKNEYLKSLNANELQMVAGEIPSETVPREILAGGCNAIDFLTEHTGIINSKGEARRAIKGNALAINRQKVVDFDEEVSTDALLHGKYLLVENGKKNKYMVIAE